ncbi:MAG: phosphatidylserine decarboxylase family protein [Candidatus Cyclonatronum sp.]|uniref:phosphatidylserine decarboxylase family protein n=1 Tax=Cyclonatronum sp. TaxID=3024185 RepID=UPI0025BE72E9|nr:phosphatidylserine decarboxylase family protein [Cyclonatronum sp.]MCC5933973.1 phosphatidylserine decarboxylase family protein [Balneolales bacterium]MCH8485572.1 phosphatidylserine decarboxylase family protein [Cyclonatronum sp.]
MFAKEGYSVIGTAITISVVLLVIGVFAGGVAAYILYILAVFVTAFTLYFFRDPSRTPPAGFEDKLIAPADGKIILLTKGLKHDFFDEPCTQISIFLSPLDVHVNRVPASGKITQAEYYPGEYLVAWHEKASELNERSEFGMVHPSGGKVFFRQITGYIARRIVFDLKEGDEVTAGEKFGMMKFGSRMDILVPDSMKLIVKPGDRTVAGESVMGIFKS